MVLKEDTIDLVLLFMKIIKTRFKPDDNGDQYADRNARCQSGNI